jgi:hypothetical protein
MHDYFTPDLWTQTVNTVVNDLIERTSAAKAELPRPYLGASIAGSDCLRRVQYDWWCTPVHTARTREIFARGHYFEERMLRQLDAAGFKFAPPEACAFAAVNGDLRGHADGIINGGPNPFNGAYFNYPFVWECKALSAKNWRALGRNGLEKEFPRYRASRALSELSRPNQSGAVQRHQCRYLRAIALLGAVRRRARAALVRSRRQYHCRHARRRIAGARLRQSERLALPHVPA